jgi:hypothetical protein
VVSVHLVCHRHWREISLSLTHELTLVRWEQQVQQDLGHSIVNLINSLYTTAAKVRANILNICCLCGGHQSTCVSPPP